MRLDSLDLWRDGDRRDPTAMEEWHAFYRLYRLCRGSCDGRSDSAVDALRFLGYGHFVWHVREPHPENSLPICYVPPILRKRLLAFRVSRRLYPRDDYEELKKRDRAVRRQMAERGEEFTLDEVAEARFKLCRKARECLVERGDWDAMFMTDLQVLRVLGRAAKS